MAITYLDQVEFGRFDNALSAERQLFRSQFDLKALVENSSQWLSLKDEFERWRQDYLWAYLEGHAHKQERNRRLQRRITSTTKMVEQIVVLEQIEAVRLGNTNDVSGIGFETIHSHRVCYNDGADIRLINEPVCTNWRGRSALQSYRRCRYDFLDQSDLRRI